MTVESNPWKDVGFITDDGKDLPEDKKKRLYLEAGGDGTNYLEMPLFID